MPRTTELHDYNLKKSQNRTKVVIFLIWFIFLATILVYIQITKVDLPQERFHLVILIIIFAVLSLFNAIFLVLLTIPTQWDDFDYSDFIKTDFDFTSSFGLKHRGFFYTRKDVDIDRDPSPKPTIIGLHGWDSHHREMDRYCLPTILQEGYLYFTYDARGQGKTPGNKNDLRQVDEAKEFIEKVLGLPYVDKKRVAVIGMSLGANKAAIVAYPNPYVKLVAMLSGPYDLGFTLKSMPFFMKIIYIFLGFKINHKADDLQKYSGINYLDPNGVILNGDLTSTPNSKRVFLAACKKDKIVNYKNTEMAVEKLNLPPSNYKIFNSGGHIFEGNEWTLSVLIYKFIKERL